MRILVSAYACNPYRGSEEAVGWNWVTALARQHQVTALVAAFHEADINRWLAEANLDITFVYVEHRWWHYSPTQSWRAIERSVAKPVMNMSYALWLKAAGDLARQLHEARPFDLCHQLTYVGFRFPGHLWKLGIPFVWGPIGGIENTAWSLLPLMGARGAIYYALRNVVNDLQRRWSSSPRKAAARAQAGMIAATSSVAALLRRYLGSESVVISEVVAPDIPHGFVPQLRHPHEPLRVVWSGQHVPGKALNLLIEAVSRLKHASQIEVHVLGEGGSTSRWKRLAERRQVGDSFVWRGHLPRSEALEIMRYCHVSVITSLKDLTSTVLVESLAVGLPVICLQHCGFPDVVDDSCGVLIDPTDVDVITEKFAQALMTMGEDESLRRRLSLGAIQRSRQYSSASLQEKISQVYVDAVRSADEAQA